MNSKRIIGMLLLVIGVVIILYANHQKNRLESAKSNIHKGSSLVPESSMKDVVSSSISKKTGEYDQQILWCFVGGTTLAVIGASMTLFCKKR